jgi:hypothetical protein
MAQSSQGIEPPANPVRFSFAGRGQVGQVLRRVGLRWRLDVLTGRRTPKVQPANVSVAEKRTTRGTASRDGMKPLSGCVCPGMRYASSVVRPTG